jgi:RimJ/RimL family protein N-acetyltransferase
MDQSLPKIIVKLADIYDLERTVDHDLIHMQELGFNDLPVHPFLNTHPFSKKEFLDKNQIRWNIAIGRAGWGRSFIALDGNKVIGHLNIKNDLETTLHRVRLGMGIEKDYRGLGIGTFLMNEAIDFCKQHHIEYIDLSVFEHNLPARQLYKKFNFIEIGIINDLFRMNEVIVNDIQMVLKF